jgi:hypothetical protein
MPLPIFFPVEQDLNLLQSGQLQNVSLLPACGQPCAVLNISCSNQAVTLKTPGRGMMRNCDISPITDHGWRVGR